MQQKKIPVRMCAGCGEHFPKKELVRIVHTPQGEVHVDPTGGWPVEEPISAARSSASARHRRPNGWSVPSNAPYPMR